jgi:predicted RNA-binding protein with TRAM domain
VSKVEGFTLFTLSTVEGSGVEGFTLFTLSTVEGSGVEGEIGQTTKNQRLKTNNPPEVGPISPKYCGLKKNLTKKDEIC